LYAIALAVLIVGLVAVGVPASTLLIAALVLTCPLMMLVMMRSMHGSPSREHHDQAPHDPAQRRDDEIHFHDADRR
jgi:hypothetical protein